MEHKKLSIRRRRISVILLFLPFVGGGEAVPGEAVVLALRLLLPVDEELEVVLSVGQTLVILGPDGGIVVLLVPRRWGEDVVRRQRAPLWRRLTKGRRYVGET